MKQERTPRIVVLVEGLSDQRALEALAARRGRDLDAEGVAVVSIGGSKNIGRFLDHLRSPRSGRRTWQGSATRRRSSDFRRGADRGTASGHDLTRAEMEALGFFVCVEDLEDELIRALGTEAVLRVVEAEGELDAFRTFQRQPQWRGRTDEERLRRFFGTFSGRKIRSGPALVDALDLDARAPSARCTPGIRLTTSYGSGAHRAPPPAAPGGAARHPSAPARARGRMRHGRRPPGRGGGAARRGSRAGSGSRRGRGARRS